MNLKSTRSYFNHQCVGELIEREILAFTPQEVTAALPPSQLSKAISRISTEYRLQFAWPRRPQLTNGETQAPIPAAGFPAGTTGPPRKSLSMGALKQGMAPTGPAPVHKKRPGDFDHKRDGMYTVHCYENLPSRPKKNSRKCCKLRIC